MPVARNQHYVPQCYLKRFTEDGASIFVFDKKTSKAFGPTDVRNVASEKGFFDVLLESVDGNLQMTEDKLSQFEKCADGLIASFLATVENNGSFDPATPDLKDALGFVVAFQFLRTREFRDTLQNAAAELGDASGQERENCLDAFVTALLLDGSIIAEKKRNKQQQNRRAVPSDTGSVEHAGMLFDGGYKFTKCAAEILKEHIWIVGDNQTDQPLYTSDAPVILLYPPDEEDTAAGLGLATKGVEVALPLSSRFILHLRERSYRPEEEVYEGKVLKLRPGAVARYNTLQVCTSYRQVYCAQDRFDLAKETVKRAPILSQIDRPRFKMFREDVRKWLLRRLKSGSTVFVLGE